MPNRYKIDGLTAIVAPTTTHSAKAFFLSNRRDNFCAVIDARLMPTISDRDTTARLAGSKPNT